LFYHTLNSEPWLVYDAGARRGTCALPPRTTSGTTQGDTWRSWLQLWRQGGGGGGRAPRR